MTTFTPYEPLKFHEIVSQISDLKNLRKLNLQDVEINPGQTFFGSKLNALFIEKLTMRLKTESKFSVDYHNMFLGDLKTTFDQFTNSGALDSVNPFRKGFEKFKYLDITLNGLYLIKKTDKEFIGSFLSSDIVHLHLDRMGTERIEYIALLRCGEGTKIHIRKVNTPKNYHNFYQLYYPNNLFYTFQELPNLTKLICPGTEFEDLEFIRYSRLKTFINNYTILPSQMFSTILQIV